MLSNDNDRLNNIAEIAKRFSEISRLFGKVSQLFENLQNDFGKSDITPDDIERNVNLYNTAEATRIYEQNQRDRFENDYDSNLDVDIDL